MKKISYDFIKKIIKKDETEIVMVKNKYDENTGEKTEEIETMIDVDMISDRINELQSEIERLTTIKTRVQNDDFDITENKTSMHGK